MLRKLPALILALLLLATPALAAFEGSLTFTHPEIGEPLTITFEHGMPLFKIYGFTYYQVMDPTVPYRGLALNQTPLPRADLPTAGEVFTAFFTSLAGQEASYSYPGALAPFAQALEALPLEDRVDALLKLNGLEGQDGYARLMELPGFKGDALTDLAKQYAPFTVNIAGQRYPFRALQLRVDEGTAHEFYLERYNFIELEGAWRLVRAVREYADEYDQRAYIHGVTGYSENLVYAAGYELLRENDWGQSRDEVRQFERDAAGEDELLVAGVELFRIPADVTYRFEQDGLVSLRYQFGNRQAYYSALISLYMRFGDPVEVLEDGTVTWCTNDTLIRLHFDKEAPALEALMA